MTLANKITILRVLLIPFFIASLLYYREDMSYLRFVAFGIFALACLTDAIDGAIARGQNQISELGIVLDPIADKLLISSAFISMSAIDSLPGHTHIPPGVVLTVITRDIIIVLGTLVMQFIKGNVVIKPSILGKITTFFQMSAMLAILSIFRFNMYFVYPAIVFTVLSGIDYIWRGSKQLSESAKA